jgi:hypothetical protein
VVDSRDAGAVGDEREGRLVEEDEKVRECNERVRRRASCWLPYGKVRGEC